MTCQQKPTLSNDEYTQKWMLCENPWGESVVNILRERERERDGTGRAAEDKIVGWHFRLALVYSTGRIGDKQLENTTTKKKKKKKRKPPLITVLRLFGGFLWKGLTEHSRPKISDLYNLQRQVRKIITCGGLGKPNSQVQQKRPKISTNNK